MAVPWKRYLVLFVLKAERAEAQGVKPTDCYEYGNLVVVSYMF